MGKIPWRRKWQATSAFWLGKFHGQRSLAGYSHKDSDTTEWLTLSLFKEGDTCDQICALKSSLESRQEGKGEHSNASEVLLSPPSYIGRIWGYQALSNFLRVAKTRNDRAGIWTWAWGTSHCTCLPPMPCFMPRKLLVHLSHFTGGNTRPRVRHWYCLPHVHKVLWQSWTGNPAFWILSSSLLHCNALSPPNQITPGRQSGVRGCLVNRQQFWRLIYSLGVTLWVLLYVHLTAEGMLV